MPVVSQHEAAKLAVESERCSNLLPEPLLMPKSLTQYRVFIGSPGGLKEEREGFRDKLQKFTNLHGEPRGVTFHPVGWEDTIGGVGRPQGIINEDLKQCDYAVFVLHDRWGTPTGSRHSSGTEEEWELAESLYKEAKVRNIALFFKNVAPRQLRDPGEQLKKVLDFKAKIEAEKKYLFKIYVRTDEFCESLEGHLAKWLRDHDGPSSASIAISSPTTPALPSTPPALTPLASPDFAYWTTEAKRLVNAEPANDRKMHCFAWKRPGLRPNPTLNGPRRRICSALRSCA
jgi:hypothetical protein